MYRNLWQPLTALYDEGEAKAIVRWVLEVRFGLTWTDIICGKVEELSPDDQTTLETILRRLAAGEPVQYVVGLADFGPRLFHVAPGVLIPRPETYELCQWIVLKRKEERGERREDSQRTDTLRMLDIGTGSGCIACTLAAEMAEAEVTAWDISEEALAIARENARLLGVNVTFEKVDILRVMERSPLDLIVSNPPYICEKERTEMERNVLEHEPETALFVPDDDPLLFYRTIAEYGRETLKRDGWLYFEINPLYVSDLRELLHVMGYHAIESKEDQYGKPRMIRAQKR